MKENVSMGAVGLEDESWNEEAVLSNCFNFLLKGKMGQIVRKK